MLAAGVPAAGAGVASPINYPGTDGRELLFQLQDLLREGVDLRVLLVDLLGQCLELRIRLVVSGRGLPGRAGAKRAAERTTESRNSEATSSRASWHRRLVVASRGQAAAPGQLAFRGILPNFFHMPERIQKPPTVPWGPKQGGDGDGPKAPDISRPDTQDLLKKMRKVDPNQSKRYRQRTGQ